MKLDYLNEFVVLAEELNYITAARKLYITQPALSRHISSLEDELGCRLIQRTTREVSLTAAGKLAAENFADLIRQYDTIRRQITLTASGQMGQLSLGILYYAIEDHLDRVLDDLTKTYPEVEVSLRSFQVPSLAKALLAGEVDVGLTFTVALPDDEHIASQPLFNEPMIILLSAKNHLAGVDKPSIRDFAEETFVYISTESWHQPFVEGLLSRYLDRMPKYIETEQIDTLARTIVERKAVALMPASSRHMTWSQLTSVRLRERGLHIESSLAWRLDNHNSALQLLQSTLA